MNLHTFLRESTWGYPIISAIHVLGIAWFGGTILIAQFAVDLRRLKWVGMALLLISGAILFWLQPAQYYNSVSFWMKMVLIVLLMSVKPTRVLSLVLWGAVIFLSRGIAFF